MKCTNYQIEVQSLANFVASVKPTAFIDVHAYSQYWMFPYGYTYSYSADHALLVSLIVTLLKLKYLTKKCIKIEDSNRI